MLVSYALTTPYQPINHRFLPISRPASTKRINSVRLSWFVLGSLFGVGLSFFLNLLVTHILVPEYDRLLNLHQHSPDVARLSVTAGKVAALEPASGSAEPAAGSEVTVTLPDTPAPDTLSPQPTEQAAAEPHEQRTLTVDRGDTLITMLVRNKVSYDEAVDVIDALRKTYDPRTLRSGQQVDVTLKPHPVLADQHILDRLSIQLGPVESVELARMAEGSFSVEKARKPLSPQLTYAGGTITNSLFETGQEHGIPHGVLAELVKAYSYDVDFQREIRRGDQMEVMFERLTTEDGDAVGYGKIFYAMLKVRGEPVTIYRYESENGEVGFFNEKGESIVKALLRTPVNGARISSGFGMRHHPILGYSRMHRGTDFAAATGTPIYAAGDGVVAFKGRKGGYGNYIKLKHNGTYETAYAHMHGFAKGMHRGKRVKQGQVIGYVGSTGRSTGPHLHYEVHKHGHKVNPME